MFKNPFSFEGRIRRLEFGLSHLIGGVIYMIIAVIVAGSGGDAGISGGSALLIFYIPYVWFLAAQGAKRCHDVGNSGWWQLIPFYGLWLLFQDGDPGSNQYGENPKGIQSLNGSSYSSPAKVNPSGNYGGGYNGGHNSSANTLNTNSTPDNITNRSEGYNQGDLYK